MTTQRPIRVLQIAGRGMDRGGVETWLVNILRNLDRERVQFDFVVHSEKKCAYDDEILQMGSRIIRNQRLQSLWAYKGAIRAVLRDNGPYDAVHCHQFVRAGLALREAERAGVPVRVAHVYDYPPVPGSSIPNRLATAASVVLVKRSANCVLACSEARLEEFVRPTGYDCSHSHVVFPCVDVERLWSDPTRDRARDEVRRDLQLPVDKPIVINVSRFAPHKNHDQIVRIADILNRDSERVHFVMVGSHDVNLNRFTELARHRSDLSVITGLVDVRDVLRASDVFFFPSLIEGFGVVAVEAAACGLPVIATNLPTIAEACAPGHRELMFPPNDDSAACASLERVLGDPEFRARLSAEGVEWSRRFHVQRSIDELTAIYQGAVVNAEAAERS